MVEDVDWRVEKECRWFDYRVEDDVSLKEQVYDHSEYYQFEVGWRYGWKTVDCFDLHCFLLRYSVENDEK